jgi:hypothetical protein
MYYLYTSVRRLNAPDFRKNALVRASAYQWKAALLFAVALLFCCLGAGKMRRAVTTIPATLTVFPACSFSSRNIEPGVWASCAVGMRPAVLFSRFSHMQKRLHLLAMESGVPTESPIRANHVVWNAALPTHMKRTVKKAKNGRQIVIVTLCF